jgi:hypothetical protein
MALVNFKAQCAKFYQKSHPNNTAMPGHVKYKPWLGFELTIVLLYHNLQHAAISTVPAKRNMNYEHKIIIRSFAIPYAI